MFPITLGWVWCENIVINIEWVRLLTWKLTSQIVVKKFFYMLTLFNSTNHFFFSYLSSRIDSICRYSVSNQLFLSAGFLFIPILPDKSFLTHNFADTTIPPPSLLSKDILCPTNGLFDDFEEAVFWPAQISWESAGVETFEANNFPLFLRPCSSRSG